MKPLLSISLLLLLSSPSPGDETDEKVSRQLVEVIQDVRATPFARIEAAKTLAKMGARASAAAEGLTAMLKKLRGDEFSDLHEAVLVALGEIGPPARNAIPEMVRSSGQNIDLDRAVKQSVNRILTGPERLDIALLISRLNDRDPAVRLQSVKSLSLAGADAAGAVPALTISLGDPDADVRRAAVSAIREISPQTRPTDAVYKVHILDLQDPDPGIRLRAAKTLGDFGPKAAIALLPLQQLLNDTDRDVRRVALDAINRISPP